jgi:mRNA-degrading endonuclease RelE of RelBE toxin-antitoxin system
VLLALAGLLALQIAVQERDRLASSQPGALPLLQRLCEPLGCRIGPPRRIEAIAIDSSGFTKLRQDTYRLNFTLKNQAPLPVAVPALELTLTDSQDQPVMRRVLTPGELGSPAQTIPPAADWSSSVAIAVAGTGAGRIAGYRLLAFYP